MDRTEFIGKLFMVYSGDRNASHEIIAEYDRLNNIINELEKYIGQEWYCFDNESIEFKVARDILDKLTELKENNK